MLDFKKIDFKNYQRKEYMEPQYENLKQNISRSWNYLKITHRLQPDECVCLRALPSKTNEYDEWCIPKELVIFNYEQESYREYERFMINKINSKRIYNFYYNIYNVNIRKAKETARENEGGFFGKSCNVGTSSVIIVDFDDFSQEDYLKMKEDFEKRGLSGTIDNMTGHGYHIVFRLKENTQDEHLLLKFIKVLQENGYTPDIQCQDCARIMRLPFFYNQKPKKYNTVVLSELTDGEYASRLFTIEEIFQAFGFDYNTFNLEQYYQKKKERKRKQKTITKITYNENEIDLYEWYKDFNVKIDELPVGIKNMMKGFKKGYTNLQVFTLTMFFKRKGFPVNEIIDIIERVESVNGNSWNTWNTSDEVERFFDNYNYINKYTLLELEDFFGEIKIEYNEKMYKIPVNVMKPKEMKIYAYLLLNNNVRKKNIISEIGLSNNTIDKIVKESSFISVKDRLYNVNLELGYKNYIYVNKDFIIHNLELSANEFSVFCYLYHRIGYKKEIRTSIQSIKHNCLISEKTITNTIKELEKHKRIMVYRDKYNYLTNSKKSNLYQMI